MRNVLVFLLFLFLPLQLHALDVYALASYWDVEDGDDTWGTGLGASIPLLTERLRLDGRVYFFEDSEVGPRDELELIPIDLGVQFHFLPNAKFDPYVLGGVSWIYADSDGFDVDSTFGGYLGGGLDFALFSVFKPFGEVLYRFAEVDTDGLREGDLEVSGLTANAGLKIHF